MKLKRKINLLENIAISKVSIINALKVALLVGLILNVINQFTFLYNYEFHKINLIKTFLTFLVPFFVSIYSSASTKLKFFAWDISLFDRDLKSTSCNKNEISIKKGENINKCPTCKSKTKLRLK